ncbi:uncharacterized protein (TIGR03083 family) [Spinactinospora alkalitolerans]|uniref:Uncharacterized protein (TIGR03083 family) n=1 Tax=Spinactinospora alkalitolerans TaxID=687207 RepID=A0A852U0M8_9ACTN|nr:DinB family protein [Spinactinospora alkalitolerans]NYE49758.1 uncharacterized protein (TIGR03083 family) [Spinactinospora alkalitolerans]
MPALVRAETDERGGLLAFLAEQRAGLRRTVHGLTDEQAASRPSASELTLGGLVKHAARTERWWMSVVLAGRPDPHPAAPETRGSDFRMEEGETVADLLAAYETAAKETEETVAALPDLERTAPLPEAPWFPQGSRRSARWILFHLIEETARHAGHADIIRESLDGTTAYELLDATGEW